MFVPVITGLGPGATEMIGHGAHESRSLVGKVDLEKLFLLSLRCPRRKIGRSGSIFLWKKKKYIKVKFPGHQPKANFFFLIYQ